MEPRTSRPPNIKPPMKVADRAKQFAPFAALGRLDDMLKAVEEGRDIGDPEHEAFLQDMEYYSAEDNEIDVISMN